MIFSLLSFFYIWKLFTNDYPAGKAVFRHCGIELEGVPLVSVPLCNETCMHAPMHRCTVLPFGVANGPSRKWTNSKQYAAQHTAKTSRLFLNTILQMAGAKCHHLGQQVSEVTNRLSTYILKRSWARIMC